ncbi:MAG: deacylase [Betaproteobacteria bacterium RIFCSPLOWO2_12_FULL_62_13]|nr:MAG: deacylase [Betaproteobacteria bacterium RIFCSPLOWO2_12_FULL_62_13]
MAIAITLKNYLDSMGVHYEVVAHAPTHSSLHTARAAHVPADHLAKPVILEDDNGYVMAVVPSNRQVRMGELSKQMSRHLRLATENELRDLFRDCALGAIPPLGTAYGLETVMDDTLPLQEDVWFEAGDHEELIHMQGAEFASLMQRAQHHHFSKEL